jgi:queuine tRNA-ribosyltransferase
MTAFSFRIDAADGAARTGAIATSHGVVRTPAFMPVGTQGAMKGVHWRDVKASGADIVLGNTYHLMLRPGAEEIAALGGLHRFINWPYPILTDSGGFQVMSLAGLRKLDDDGVVFRSHLDGATVALTPERAIEIQTLLGSDIAMQLDECIRLPQPRAELERAMNLSLAWAERCKRAFTRVGAAGLPRRALFGIVQGGDDRDLRAASARALATIGFDGYAIGGLAVGEPQAVMLDMIETVVPLLPADRPRYLMGVGTPDDLLEAVSRGIDMFDCVLPTRSGRTAQAFTRRGQVNLRNARHGDDPAPLDAECGCPACTGYSRAYLHHLCRGSEILGAMLLTAHNLQYYADLMADMRAAIENGTLADFAAAFATAQTPTAPEADK